MNKGIMNAAPGPLTEAQHNTLESYNELLGRIDRAKNFMNSSLLLDIHANKDLVDLQSKIDLIDVYVAKIFETI